MSHGSTYWEWHPDEVGREQLDGMAREGQILCPNSLKTLSEGTRSELCDPYPITFDLYGSEVFMEDCPQPMLQLLGVISSLDSRRQDNGKLLQPHYPCHLTIISLQREGGRERGREGGREGGHTHCNM